MLITGGSSGIGFAFAKRCVSEGAFVTLMSRKEDNLAKARDSLLKTVGCQSDRILLKAVDVTDAAAVSLAIQESFRWRPIDILVCNAGRAISGPLDAVDVKDLDLVARTNFLGCVYPVHAALPLMKLRSIENPSSIVFVSSLSALLFVPEFNLYTPTKYALKGLAEMLRIELLPYNIRVNLVCPGYTETPMLDEADKAASASELLNKLTFYDRAYAELPDEVAAKTIEGIKKGSFLITSSISGFLIGVLSRGVIPAESPPIALIEFILLSPMRICSFIWFAYMRRILQKHFGENLQKRQETQVENTYVHSIDDSAADDDANLILWSH